jgi:guanylate kinase
LSEREPNVIIVSAPSGAGKSTVVARVLRELSGIRFSVSHATRAPRPGEREGVDYHFVDRAEFERLVGEGAFLEWADVHGDLKGTASAEIDRARLDGVDLLLDVDVQGAEQVRRRVPGAVSIFILPPSFRELEARLRGRGQDPEAAILRRLDNARREVARYPEYEYIVVNDDLETAVNAVKCIVQAVRQRRVAQEAAVRSITDTFEDEGRPSKSV